MIIHRFRDDFYFDTPWKRTNLLRVQNFNTATGGPREEEEPHDMQPGGSVFPLTLSRRTSRGSGSKSVATQENSPRERSLTEWWAKAEESTEAEAATHSSPADAMVKLTSWDDSGEASVALLPPSSTATKHSRNPTADEDWLIHSIPATMRVP